MKMFSKAAALGTTAILAGLVGATGAYAQIEQITVTSQKREQTLQDTPVSVAAVTDEQIQQSQIRDASDLQTLVPSLRVAEFATATNTEFSLRGIGTSSFNAGLEPSVGVFVDGVYRPRTGAAINDLLSVERVEVIRGPQSTLFGRNTPAGVVSFITMAPEFETGYAAEATVGNYDQRILAGTFTGPLSDNVAFRLDGTWHENSGYLETVDGREMNNRNRSNFRGQILWNPSDLTTVRVIADYGIIDENCCAAPFANYDAATDLPALVGLGGTAVPANPFGGIIAIDGTVNTELTTSGISAQVDHEFDNYTFTSITAFREYDETQIFDADFSDLDLVSFRGIGNEYTSFTQELRVTSTGDNRVDWMFGGFYYDNDLVNENSTPYGTAGRAFFDAASAVDPTAQALIAAFGLPAGSGGVDLLEFFLDMQQLGGVGAVVPLPSGSAALPTTPAEGFISTQHGLQSERFEYDTTSWSAFAQFDFHVTDDFTVTVGGRYTSEDKDMTTFVDQPDPISTFSFVDLARDMRLVNPADPAVCPAFGAPAPGGGILAGDGCAYLVPALILQGFADGLAGAGLNPANPADLPIIAALAQPYLDLGFNVLDPATAAIPLTAEQAGNPLLNPLLGFQAFQNFPPVNAGDFPTSRNDTNFSGTVIASYDVSDDLNVYGSYSTGFKPGGFNVSSNAAFTGVFEFEEEISTSFEIGAKGALDDGRFRYAVAYFNQEIEDFQSNNFVGNGFALENAGSIEVSGIEFESQWAPTDNLFFTGGFTYLIDNQYGEYPFAPCPDRNVDGSGVWDAGDPNFALCELGNERTNPFGATGSFNNFNGRDRGSSELVGSVTGTYTTQLRDGIMMALRGEATYVDEYLHTTSQDPRPFAMQEDFTLYNASVTFSDMDEAWALQLWTRNLTDEEYTKGGFPSVGYLGTSYNAYVGDPQTYGLTLRIRG